MSQQEEMSFWDHLEELRWTLFRCAIALVVFTIGALIANTYIFDPVILGPRTGDFVLYRMLCKLTSSIPFLPDFCDPNFKAEIFNVNLTSPFFLYVSTSFWMAFLITFPYIVLELWKFIKPALYENEKKNVKWVFLTGTILFYTGCAVGYFLVFPMTFRFLVTFRLSDAIAEQVGLESYIETLIMMVFIMGVVFEMPLLSWFLSKLGLLNRSFFNKYRRHAIVGLMAVAALITPSGDPFTLGSVFLPLYGLYELSAFFVKKPPEEDKEENEDIVKYEAD